MSDVTGTPLYVWAVSQGSHDLYHVLCVCPSEGAATRVAAAVNKASEPHGLFYEAAYVDRFPYVTGPGLVTTHVRRVSIDRDGAASDPDRETRVEERALMADPGDAVPARVEWHGYDGRGCLTVTGTNEDLVDAAFTRYTADIIASPELRDKKWEVLA